MQVRSLGVEVHASLRMQFMDLGLLRLRSCVVFGARGHVQKSRSHENEGFENSPISKSKSY